MARTVRAALLQTDWTGDKGSMIDKHEAQAREAAKQGAQVMCFQELFYGPYFCQVQEFSMIATFNPQVASANPVHFGAAAMIRRSTSVFSHT